ncbi:MAG: hypothetical protein PUE49_05225 [Eggerthellales bacterium]|nr:hypothetical protein [Eggerthellales bacterium]
MGFVQGALTREKDLMANYRWNKSNIIQIIGAAVVVFIICELLGIFDHNF